MESESRQKDIINEFEKLHNWEERYRYIIQIGKKLPKMEDHLYQSQFLVKGCQSQVWLFAQVDEKGRMMLKADSDALIVKGLVSLLLRLYSGLPPDEVLKTKPHFFIERLGFREHLSPIRANGFLSMVKQIMFYAQAFTMLQQKG